jgi:hypothetical protein
VKPPGFTTSVESSEIAVVMYLYSPTRTAERYTRRAVRAVSPKQSNASSTSTRGAATFPMISRCPLRRWLAGSSTAPDRTGLRWMYSTTCDR